MFGTLYPALVPFAATGLVSFLTSLPTACAAGCILAPLRGFRDVFLRRFAAAAHVVRDLGPETIAKKAPLLRAGLLTCCQRFAGEGARATRS